MADGCSENGEELVWLPGRIDKDELEAYIGAARSMVASYANMADRRSADESVASARRDENTQMALNHLHKSNYNKNLAVAEFVKNVPLIRSIDRRWDEEDSKKFMKGLRVFGKNFFRIRKEFLPEKETKELIEYYYYWKKTPISNISSRAQRRSKPHAVGSTNKNTSGEGSSESEDVESGESYVCFRCDSETSAQWHYVDDHGFVCESCKLNYRKYGDDKTGEKIPEYLFRPVEPASSYRRPPIKRKIKTEADPDDGDDMSRKSPSSSSSTCSETTKSPRKRKSPVRVPPLNGIPKSEAAEIPDSELEEGAEAKKKKVMDQCSPDSLASELRSHADDAEDNGNMGDVEQDDATSTNSDDSLSDSKYLADESVAKPCYETFLEAKNAHLIRCLKREENSCSRVDVFYMPPPNSVWAKRREEKQKKPLAIAQPSMAPPVVQNAELKVKTEPISEVQKAPGIVPIHHSGPIVKAAVTPMMPSPHHMSSREMREAHQMTPTHSQSSSASTISAADHHRSMAHGGMTPGAHRRAPTPSQRVTPRAEHHPFMPPNTPALSQLSQLAGRPQPHNMADEYKMAFAAAAAAAASPTSLAAQFGMLPQMDMIQSYRMMRTMMPVEQLDRIWSTELRERMDMLLKAQELDQQKFMMAAGVAGGPSPSNPSLDTKAFLEAQVIDMQRRLGRDPLALSSLGLHPGALNMMQAHPGLAGIHPSMLPSSGLQGAAAMNEQLMRDRERMQKLGFGGGLLSDSLASLSATAANRMSSSERLQADRLAAAASLPTAHSHTHTHTHLHLHQQAEAAAAAAAMAAQAQNPYIAQQLLQSLGMPEAMALARAAAAGGVPFAHMPPNFPSGLPAGMVPPSGVGPSPSDMLAAMMMQRPDMDPREFLAFQQMFANPALAAQETFQRQMLDRERQLSSHHMPH